MVQKAKVKSIFLRRLSAFFQMHGPRILVSILVFLSLIASFEIGFLYARETIQEPLVIEKVQENCPSLPSEKNSQNLSENDILNGDPETTATMLSTCLFVGSKNSDKYHSPTCSWAKRIKPENRRCFSSAEEAKQAGYQEGCIEK